MIDWIYVCRVEDVVFGLDIVVFDVGGGNDKFG